MREIAMHDDIKQKGFTLVEMAVILLIVGLVVGAFFAFYSSYLEETRQQTTVERLNKIARALGDYAERTGYLPCPGRPEDLPLGVESLSCSVTSSGTANGSDGIVPFRVLGLSREDVTDGFYNPITYALSPLITRQVSAIQPPLAHANCRTSAWNPTATASLDYNKALLCCRQMISYDKEAMLQIYNNINMADADHMVPLQKDPPLSPQTAPVLASFANPNTLSVGANNDNLAYFAYILISHGKNGEGAYTFGESARRPLVRAGNGEIQNANHTGGGTDIAYVDLMRNDSRTAPVSQYYDDIVLWRTQQGLVSELGNNSCAAP